MTLFQKKKNSFEREMKPVPLWGLPGSKMPF